MSHWSTSLDLLGAPTDGFRDCNSATTLTTSATSCVHEEARRPLCSPGGMGPNTKQRLIKLQGRVAVFKVLLLKALASTPDILSKQDCARFSAASFRATGGSKECNFANTWTPWTTSCVHKEARLRLCSPGGTGPNTKQRLINLQGRATVSKLSCSMLLPPVPDILSKQDCARLAWQPCAEMQGPNAELDVG